MAHMNRDERAVYLELSPQDKVLYVVDLSGAAGVSSTTDPSRNTVHHRAAKALVAKGVLEYTVLHEYVRRPTWYAVEES
jgi:hypothetical protein